MMTVVPEVCTTPTGSLLGSRMDRLHIGPGKTVDLFLMTSTTSRGISGGSSDRAAAGIRGGNDTGAPRTDTGAEHHGHGAT